MMREFRVPGIPGFKQRHRTTKTGHTFTPEDTVNFENFVKWCFVESLKGEKFPLIDGPIRLHIKAYWTATQKDAFLCKNGPFPKITKPDSDNVLKAIKDALNGVAWTDDSRVYHDTITKYIHNAESYCDVSISW